MEGYSPASNYAFIDGQNLHQGLSWPIDYRKFRVYLKDKYRVEKAYYFLGFRQNNNALYDRLTEAGFEVVFNLKGRRLVSKKKGNVDTNLVFGVMKKLLEQTHPGIVVISGDGDYKMMIDYLIQRGNFVKLLVPSKQHTSSLYTNKKYLARRYIEYIDTEDLKQIIGYKKSA